MKKFKKENNTSENELNKIERMLIRIGIKEKHHTIVFFVSMLLLVVLLNPLWVLFEKLGISICSPLDYPDGLQFFSSTLLTVVIASYQIKLDKRFNELQKRHEAENELKHHNELVENVLKELEKRFKAKADVSIKNGTPTSGIKECVTIKIIKTDNGFLFPSYLTLKETSANLIIKRVSDLEVIHINLSDKNAILTNKYLIFRFNDESGLEIKKLLWEFLNSVQYNNVINNHVSELQFEVIVKAQSTINREIDFEIALELALIPQSGYNDNAEFVCCVDIKRIYRITN